MAASRTNNILPHDKVNEKSIEKCFDESIKCHHVGISNYFLETYFDEKEEGTILLILKLISNLRIKQFNYYILLNVLPSSIISKLVRTLSEQHLRTLYQQQQSQGKTKNSTQYLTQQNSPYSMRNINKNCYALESLDFNEIFDSLLYTVFMPE